MLLFTPLAAQDLEDIADYIAQDNPARALSFVAELQAQCQTIARQPALYRLRSDLLPNVRSCAYGNYVIFFQSLEKQVTVVRILHGTRDLPAAFSG